MDFPTRIPFAELLEIELLAMADGRSSLRLELREPLLNSWHVAHGGVVMTLLDVAMAHAARSVDGAEPGCGSGLATIEMKSSFMRAATGTLLAEGTLLHRTATMAFCEASVVDSGGALCAHGTGTFKFLRAMPAVRRRAAAPERTSEAADPAPDE